MTETQTTRRRVALVSCGASKLGYRAPAARLYTSGLFRLSVAYAEDSFDVWYILSAFHELVEPAQELSPYDRSMRELSKGQREAWAIRVAGRLRNLEPGCAVPGTRKLGGPAAATVITLLAGRDYAEPLAPYIEAEQPLAGLPIGRRLQWLRRQVQAVAADAAENGGACT